MPKPGPEPEVTGDDVLAVFERREDASEPLTAPEIAETLECSRRTALDRLRELAKAGLLERKDVGARATVYWIATPRETESAPAEPLRSLSGMFEAEEAEAARRRSKRWRETFEDELDPGAT